ncbi:basic leucine zipper 61-like [Impatiens glandulifera]|uniref:basic leucine zipper 61-like n=1 Tax=Impatiens glandulifera TaxID=253017 RepID=UPI001FB148E5|nr:basic leucine zipper 61-like [Impatiens glandulifera]
MAQLPPKVPNLTTSIWPITTATTSSSGGGGHNNPSWVDEFLDFSATRRGSHRRSISDSIAFIETPLLMSTDDQTCRAARLSMHDFDRIDDEQFMSMFADDHDEMPVVAPTLSSSNTSSPSDHNSINDDKQLPSDLNHHHHHHPKSEPDEAESDSTTLFSNKTATTENYSSDKIVDPKRVKRILANRQSAQRSRVRKLQYISELERSVSSLQAEVSVLSPRVAFLDHQRLILNVDNSALKQRIAALAQDKIFKDAHQDALRREIERLRNVYHEQNLKKIETSESKKMTLENCELLES